MSVKLCVIGNCQARPIETILKAMCPSITCMGTIIVHLAKSGNAGTDIALMHEADIILAQSVQENYPVAHLRTATLRASFGNLSTPKSRTAAPTSRAISVVPIMGEDS